MTYISSYQECPSCGSDHKGKPFCVYENGVHCFSCGYTKSYDRTFSPTIPRDIQSLNPNNPEWNNMKSRMDQFSLTNQIWLNKYYITKDDVKNNNILEAPDGALVFCTIENNRVLHYQKRYNTVPRRILSYGQKRPSKSSIDSPTIVLVEDYISYIRVGEFVDCICLFGTKISYEELNSLLGYANILVWLDNDKTKETNSGQEAAKKICKMLERVLRLKQRRFGFGGVNVPKFSNIVTGNDPKTYSPSEIQDILGVTNASTVRQ